MIETATRLVTDPRFRLTLLLLVLLLSGVMFGCDDPWEPLPPWEH
jgi:hypothetical protein